MTEKEFKKEIAKMDPAHRVLARIERAKQQMRLENQPKEQESWHSHQTSQ